MNKYVLYGLAVFFSITTFIIFWLKHPLPNHTGEIIIKDLKKTVEVYTDEYGVPHIFADNEEDLLVVVD